MNCEWCKNKFSTKTNLNHHQLNAKYCLKIRGKKNNEQYLCGSCTKSFKRKYELSRHMKICKTTELVEEFKFKIHELEKNVDILRNQVETKDEYIEKLELTIETLQNKLENVAIKAVTRPTITNNKTQINNYIQKLQPITDTTFIDSVPNLTIDHILKGPEGYAQYALEYPLKDRMICVDYARRKVKFKDKDGNVITDPEMTQLTTKFFNSIKDKNKELIFQYGNELKERFGDEMDTIVEILDYKIAVDKGSEGERSDLHHDFVKQMCSQTLRD